MSNEELLQIESSQRQFDQEKEHREKMNLIVEQEEYNLVTILKPKITRDGNQWCVLYGENLQDGIAGFGETPYTAILNFNKAWNEKI